MAATLLAINERVHVDLSDDDIGAEPAVLGATDCSFFIGPNGENFTSATSIVGSRTFPSWLRAMRRSDLMDDPRFSSAAARRLNFGALHQIIQTWMLTFSDMATLDAQLDEAKIAMGEIRTTKELTQSEWSEYWGAVQTVSDRNGGEYRLPGRPWHFSAEELTPIGTPAFQGEHNREVLGELGLSDGEIRQLMDAGVLVTHHRVQQQEPAVNPQPSPVRPPDLVKLR
jgi:crotonobetainyl-CoA:carnitine CoA-transferase CaiB-like acyl-CoA transferase